MLKFSRLSTFGYEESRLAELKEQNKLNAELSSIFLEFMVNLFRLQMAKLIDLKCVILMLHCYFLCDNLVILFSADQA